MMHPREPTGSALGHQYALHALRERRAQITGEIAALEARARSLRRSLDYLDGTLAIMAPGFDPATIKPKSQRKAKLFGADQGCRT